MKRPSVNATRVSSPAEHEVWLSFQNDSDAVHFQEWWDTEGFHAYVVFHERAENKIEDDDGEWANPE